MIEVKGDWPTALAPDREGEGLLVMASNGFNVYCDRTGVGKSLLPFPAELLFWSLGAGVEEVRETQLFPVRVRLPRFLHQNDAPAPNDFQQALVAIWSAAYQANPELGIGLECDEVLMGWRFQTQLFRKTESRLWLDVSGLLMPQDRKDLSLLSLLGRIEVDLTTQRVATINLRMYTSRNQNESPSAFQFELRTLDSRLSQTVPSAVQVPNIETLPVVRGAEGAEPRLRKVSGCADSFQSISRNGRWLILHGLNSTVIHDLDAPDTPQVATIPGTTQTLFWNRSSSGFVRRISQAVDSIEPEDTEEQATTSGPWQVWQVDEQGAWSELPSSIAPPQSFAFERVAIDDQLQSVCFGSRSRLYLFDIATGERRWAFRTRRDEVPTEIGWTNDSLVALFRSGAVVVSRNEGELVSEIELNSLANPISETVPVDWWHPISSDASRFIVNGSRLALTDLSSKQVVQSTLVENSNLFGFDNDLNRIVSMNDRDLSLYQAEDGKRIERFDIREVTPLAQPAALQMSPGGDRVLVLNRWGEILIGDLVMSDSKVKNDN